MFMIEVVFSFVILTLTIMGIFKVKGASKKIIDFMSYVPKINSRGGLTMFKSHGDF